MRVTAFLERLPIKYYLDPSLHKAVRSLYVKYMTDNEELYSQFIDDDHLNFTQYIERLKLDGSWAGNPEITALSQVLECPIEVYEESKPIKVNR